MPPDSNSRRGVATTLHSSPQPLDIGLFPAIYTYYAQGYDQRMATGQGLIHITKRNFGYSVEMCGITFTTTNIEASWRATRLHPLNPDKVLSLISSQSDISPPGANCIRRYVKAPVSLRAIRQSLASSARKGQYIHKIPDIFPVVSYICNSWTINMI
ncbi:uncharacterized protein ATNIH1004_001542 [Aspergillus tanneri]|uniref:Uncharacterized protein n=1 Tax=Aspergillus tanneri TaxID=1220188 RepID=A0A5M9ND83_9EURO|nr:uncharacterized protein ATNIH1004_001542 [Aspergillus tanneri]KAA8652637.1 hypothetical protein ATNIH1004_001542 [Aspergillus tanneri]